LTGEFHTGVTSTHNCYACQPNVTDCDPLLYPHQSWIWAEYEHGGRGSFSPFLEDAGCGTVSTEQLPAE